MSFQHSTKKLSQILFVLIAMLVVAASASAQSSAAASREYKRLLKLSNDLKKIPFDRYDKEPHRTFLKRNDKDIVYSEPAGQWFVRSGRFWDLYKKYAKLPIADDIAWSAADNPLPGECEGYVNCYMYNIRVTYGEYLRLFPNGKHSKKAVDRIVEYQQYMADDEYTNYEGPGDDAAERSDLKKMITELRDILTKASPESKTKALEQLAVIESRFAR
ncbi:MAG: hypothetical protein IPM50_10805 [Acidobacteriota bacterium]|nr:MAG: hypothetical protein IPM50_10805 [Acidobacteriota bacterium]